MRLLLLPLAILAAAAVLAGIGWMMLASPPAPAPPPRPRSAPRVEVPSPPVFAPEEEEPEEAPPPPERPPDPAPDAWPGDVPAWWIEADRRFREKSLSITGETLSMEEIAALLERECGFAVRFEDRLREWSREYRLALPSIDGPGRALVEAISTRLNLEPVLEPDALRFYQRGRAPDTPAARAGRIRWAVLEAVERRDGKREPDPDAPDLDAVRIALPLRGVPLREAVRLLGEAINIPVYLDGPLWLTNPSVTTGPGELPLSEILRAMTDPWGAAVDATQRRIVLFKPPR